MPVIGFKEKFVPLIIAGTKRQTIRKMRKRPFKKGDTLYLYRHHRTPQAEKIGEYFCRDVAEIEINRYITMAYPLSLNLKGYVTEVFVGGWRLLAEEIDELAQADGFKTTKEFEDFFFNQYGNNFKGQLIKW